ncbi:hypothetical protein BSKO_10996 [Bryopsis sp. KO-2023]|nr:hypothetical protein BSKO_10996 [Bryopsis sp. KO-2023]
MIWGIAAVLMATMIVNGLWSGTEGEGKMELEGQPRFNRKLLQMIKGGENERKIIKEAIQDGLVDEYVGEGGTTPLSFAVQGEHLDLIAELVEAGADVEKETKRGTGITPLMVAATGGSLAAAKDLLKHGANIDAVNDKGRTALWRAAYFGDLEMVEYLVGKNATSDLQDRNGYTALMAAVHNSFAEVSKFLMDSEADVDLATAKRGQSPLWVATFNGDVEIMEDLLAAGANPNQASKDGVVPLTLAVHRNCEECASLLLENGADPNTVDRNKWTPLHQAAAEGNEGMVEILLRFGADRNAQDAFLHKPVHTIGRNDASLDSDIHRSIYQSLTRDPVPDGFALVRGGNCEANNLNSSDRHGKKLSLEDCAKACNDHVRCVAFVHHKGEFCFLKHESCNDPDITNPFYLIYDKLPNGYQRVKGQCVESEKSLLRDVKSLQECADACREQGEGCVGFTYSEERVCEVREKCSVSEVIDPEGYLLMKVGETSLPPTPPEPPTRGDDSKRSGFLRVRGAYLHIGWVIALVVVVAALISMQIVCIRVHRQRNQRSPTPATDALSGGRTPTPGTITGLHINVPRRRSLPEITPPTETRTGIIAEASRPNPPAEVHRQNVPSPPLEESPFACRELHESATIRIRSLVRRDGTKSG